MYKFISNSNAVCSDTGDESDIDIDIQDDDGGQNDEESELEDDGGDSESSDDRHLYEIGNNCAMAGDSDSLEFEQDDM